MQSLPDQRNPNISRQGVPGVIDTIGLAFSQLNRRPYLIWIPVVFDVLVWSGFRVSLIEPIRIIDSWNGQSSGLWSRATSLASERFAEIELIHVISILIPTLVSDPQRDGIPSPLGLKTFLVEGGVATSLLMALVLGTVIVGMSYLTLIGRLVSDAPARGLTFVSDCVKSSAYAVGVVLAAFALLIFMMFPFVLIGAGLWSVGVDPVSLVILAGVILAIVLGVFLVFSVPSLALGQRSVFGALRASYQAVLQNFLSVLGLLLIVILIRAGTPHALSVFTNSEWSVPFAIIANAYVATGLIAALMFFFQHRAFARPSSSEGASAAASG